MTPQAFDDIDRDPSLKTQGAADEGERNGPEVVFIDIVNAVFSSLPSKISHLLTNTLVLFPGLSRTREEVTHSDAAVYLF